MIRVFVVAASPVVRAGLSAVVATSSKLTVVGTASDLDALTREFEQLQPDVLLLDVSGHFQELVWEKLLSSQQQPYPAIVVLTDELDSLDLEAALRAGVRSILPSSSTESEIVAAVEAIALGLVVLHSDTIEFLLPLKESSVRDKQTTNPVQALTPREIEVLQMLGSGLSNKAIAKRLNISEHTVKFHVSSIFQKLSVSTRTEAVTVGVRLGLIML
ncbi:MAG: response regulator transcription factor [Brasilonema octagenarum HA4186-MV1]|jgi:DNA-binding NarL/FixJ family response regulator|uniref:DNA-binding response regulator n=2 Tax=Brasilonema TaxID=383614 RepID=A0A856MHW8_9CYAN|nr:MULTISPECIES: response regulator transcription factor [Brasilonema]MBW4624787.1 response regulator transcription factor [Brasilonema octagenarum HA4186-MV1]NMF62718.1 DNA-binding response regulator [Brasilonema octagenarum UFV-OR1]QDL10162.1 DNA-binding response regulator [Brasilonema sennae CENA114]QDL16515.1 DNA-binding response regulator [Brasilonema octagenarum UFV-E1]